MSEQAESVKEASSTFKHLGNIPRRDLTAREAAAAFASEYWTPGRAVSVYELVPGNPLAIEFQVRNGHAWYRAEWSEGDELGGSYVISRREGGAA